MDFLIFWICLDYPVQATHDDWRNNICSYFWHEFFGECDCMQRNYNKNEKTYCNLMDFCLNSHGGRRNFGNRCLPPRQQNPIIHGCSCHKNFTDFHLCEYSGFVILALGLLNTWILKWRQNQGWADERQKRSRWVRRSGTLSNELRSGKSGIWDDKEMKWEMEKWRNNIFCYLIIFIFILSIKAFIRGGFAKSIVKMEINEFYWKWIAKRLERGFLIRLMVEEEGIIDWLRK